MTRFEGRCAIVSGGASGIGLRTAERFVAEGGRVSLWDVDQAKIDAAVTHLGTAARGVRVNVTDPDAVARAAAETAAAFGKIDIMVCAAGIAGMNVPVADYPVAEWKRILDVNLNGLFYCNRAVVPFLKKNGYGRIVNIASIAGKEGNPTACAYSASKAGVIGLTKSLGKELAGYDIAVNAVTPAAAKTAIFDQMTKAHIDFMLSKIPLGRFGEIDEIASLVCWLASEECSFSTGAAFDISGGRATY